MGWAKSMPFASINPTNPRTNPWNFHEKILRIGGAGKWGFFEAAILNFLSRPFWFFFASYQWKTQPIYMRYHFLLHYGWFFQNLGKKKPVRTFMHTNVSLLFKLPCIESRKALFWGPPTKSAVCCEATRSTIVWGWACLRSWEPTKSKSINA